MKRMLKSRFFSFIFGALMFGCLSVVFAYSYVASDVGFDTTDSTWNVDNVRDALDYLRHNQKYGNYSLAEREIGKWIDGKTAFEKVVPITLPGATTGVSVPHNISNFGGLISLDIIWYDTSDKRWFTGTRYYYGNGSGYSIGSEALGINETYILISGLPNTINWAARTTDAYAIIQYWKTT